MNGFCAALDTHRNTAWESYGVHHTQPVHVSRLGIACEKFQPGTFTKFGAGAQLVLLNRCQGARSFIAKREVLPWKHQFISD